MPLVSVVVGALIAFVGQAVAGRVERRGRIGDLLLDQCAQVVALEEDFRNRLWEERHLDQKDRVAGWDLVGYRLAAARIRLLASRHPMALALDEVRRAGTALGRYWRLGKIDEDEIERLWVAHKNAIEAFVVAARGEIGKNRLRRRTDQSLATGQ